MNSWTILTLHQSLRSLYNGDSDAQTEGSCLVEAGMKIGKASLQVWYLCMLPDSTPVHPGGLGWVEDQCSPAWGGAWALLILCCLAWLTVLSWEGQSLRAFWLQGLLEETCSSYPRSGYLPTAGLSPTWSALKRSMAQPQSPLPAVLNLQQSILSPGTALFCLLFPTITVDLPLP